MNKIVIDPQRLVEARDLIFMTIFTGYGAIPEDGEFWVVAREKIAELKRLEEIAGG